MAKRTYVMAPTAILAISNAFIGSGFTSVLYANNLMQSHIC